MDNIKNVKSVFDEELAHLKFDNKLAKKFNEFQINFTNKNEDHMMFFGGNLFGVQTVRFSTQDTEKWFTDILEADDISLEEKILETPVINPLFHVSSDLFNLSALWLIHKFMNSPLLNDKQKQQAMLDVALIMHYRFMTSLLYRYFKFPADPQVAAATYAQLSYKFAIKQYGSWYATIVARCEDFLSDDSIHHKTLKKFNDDTEIVYMVNDAQGRIRDMFKNLYAVFIKTNQEGVKINSTSTLSLDHDGEQIVKDKTKNLLSYTRYLHSIVGDKNSFIKDEIMGVICSVLHTMPPKLLRQTLEWTSANYRHMGAVEVEEVIDLTLTHSFSYLSNNRNVLKDNNDLAGLISKLRGVYMSSRSTEIELLEMRSKAESIVKFATHVKNDSVIASVRTGFLLYLVTRAYTKNHYS